MTSIGWFITGTDTGVGKTRVACALMQSLHTHGRTVVGMKPVASGGHWQAGAWHNEDALALQAAASCEVPYADVNPYCYETPIAPHLAAQEARRPVQLAPILAAYARLAARATVVVEGAGGWLVPLGPGLDISALAKVLDLPVVLVVGIRLGCINHALLTMRAIREDGVRWQGWVANMHDPDVLRGPDVVATLTERMGPPLAVLAYAARELDIRAF